MRDSSGAAEECSGEHLRSRSGVALRETMENIEESRAARLAGDSDRYSAISRRAKTLLRRDQQR